MILITGGEGQLGRALCMELTRCGIPHKGLGRDKLDVTDAQSVRTSFEAYKPDVVLHCAAFSKVDLAEEQEALCYKVNVEGTRLVAEESKRFGAYFLYISSDYVFDGMKQGAYEIDDVTNPLSVYGKSKVEGEKITLAVSRNNAVLRTSWLFGHSSSNFVEAILRISQKKSVIDVVADQIGSPTFTEDLADLILEMVNKRCAGIFHGTNEGICSWAQFAREILVRSGAECVVREVTSKEYGSKASRPLNSVMSKKSLDQAGIVRLPDWQDALRRYLNKGKDFNKACL